MTLFQDAYRGKKVLITGHTGFKGSWLSLWLQKLGAEVVGVSQDIPTRPSHWKLLGDQKNSLSTFQSYTHDLRDLQGLQEIFHKEKPQMVFHLAAQSIVGHCVEFPTQAFSTNVLGTVHLLECLRHTPGVQAAVIITSDKCYENVEWEYGYRERDQLGGKDPYSASKACAEVAFSSYFRTYFQKNTSTTLATTRAGNVIGGGDWGPHRIVPDCMRSWSNGRPVVIRSPQATRPWQHVLEPLSGYLWLGRKLLDRPQLTNGESFNFGPESSREFSVQELIEQLQQTWTKSIWTQESSHSLQGKEATLLKLNCEKAATRLQWRPVLDFYETAQLTAQWYHDFYLKRDTDVMELSSQQIEHYQTTAKERGHVWTR